MPKSAILHCSSSSAAGVLMVGTSEFAAITRNRSGSPAILGARAAVILLFMLVLFGAAATGQVTTYTALTANNTSAALPPQTTGASSQNVSKISITTQLPSGSTTPIYAHLMVWFGTSTHQDVGYSSTDATQAQKQVTDMLSRGISGVIINWHGASDFTDQAALVMMAEVNNYPGRFQFSIEEDAQTLASCAATTGCDLTSKVVSDLTYVQKTYTGAATYMNYQGNPIIFLYGMEAYNLNWTQIRASLTGNPVLIFRSASTSSSTQVADNSTRQHSSGRVFEAGVLADTPNTPRKRGLQHA